MKLPGTEASEAGRTARALLLDVVVEGEPPTVSRSRSKRICTRLPRESVTWA
jgi:hypothetical protein